MFAEIISNGDELTSGKVLDSNSQWLSCALFELGIRVLYHTTVGDDFDVMCEVLRVAVGRVDLVIWTGGLGPTADDLTRQVLAAFAKVPLVLDIGSLDYIRLLFKRRGLELPESNKIQAYLPQNAAPIFNPQGTAPGVDLVFKIDSSCVEPAVLTFDQADNLSFKDCVRVLAFPGVPAELHEMWSPLVKESLRAMLRTKTGCDRVIKSRVINCFGAGESSIESLLPDIINRNHIPRVGITASRGTISLRVMAEGADEVSCDDLILPVVELIYSRLSEFIFSEGAERLQDVVCRELGNLGKTVAVIESGTRGNLAAALADTVESKKCFRGGIVLPLDKNRTTESEIELGKRLFDADYFLIIGNYPEIENQISQNKKNNTTTLTILENKNNKIKIISKQNHPFTGHSNIIDDIHIKKILNTFRQLLKTIVPTKID
jgi:nicotinamide-nucleotide amidase